MWLGVALLCALLLSLGCCGELGAREGIQRIDITEGDTLTLTCIGKPTHLRSYRWVYIRKGTRKPRVLSSGRRLVLGEPRLSIDAVREDDHVKLVLKMQEIRPYEAGLFMCWRQGLKPDPQVYVRVLEAGVTEAEPLSIEISAPSHVDYGGPVTINCLIRPSWPGKIEWLRNGTVITSSDRVYTQEVEERPGGELLATLKAASVRQGANYRCRVPSSPVAEASFNLAVRVARIESLTSQPSKDSVEYGQSFTIMCTVSETDDKVLWLKDGENLNLDPDDPRRRKWDETLPSGSMKSTLHIESFSLQDNGQYVCYVPGDSKGIVVNIEGRLPRVTGIKGWDFVIGDVLRLTCATQYAKDDQELSWLFEEKPLRSDWWAEEVIRKDNHNITHHDLSLPIPTRGHVGTYTCTTPYGSASTVVREIVPPYVEESPPRNVNVPVGEKLSLPCSVAGYPVPTVIWEKNIDDQWKIVEEVKTEGEPDVDGIMVNTQPLVDGDKRVGERQELVLEQAYPFHAGKYRCRGYNDEDSIVVETEVVTSDPEPTVLEMTADVVLEGEDLKISCSVTDWEGPVEFTHGLRVLGQDGDPKYEAHLVSKDEREITREGQSGRSYKTKQKIFTHVLIITGITLDDQGFYECHAGSDAQGAVEVTVKQLPPEVVEVAASLAVEGEEFFVSCTIAHMPTGQQAIFYFNGRKLTKEEDPRYSTYLAELTDEVVINSKGRAKQATYVAKVANAVQDDSGVYHCVVGSDTKGSITVEVEAKENVEEVFLEASSAWSGGDLIIKCRVTNWDKDVTFMFNQTMLLGEEDSRFDLRHEKEENSTVHTLTIFGVTVQDSGLYQCFTSPLISAEVNVTIGDLSGLNVILEQEHSKTPLWINTPLVLSCRLKGFKPYSHAIEFSHNGLPYLYLDTSIKGAQVNQRASLLEDDDGGELSLEENELAYRMKLDGVMEGDGGKWFCRATMTEALFADEDFVEINVYEPPRFTDTPSPEVTVEYGGDSALNCIASGLPLPQVVWFKKGVEEPLVNHTEFARLKISAFSENDTGVYICEATSLGQVIQFETTLQIKKELQIIEMPEPEIEVTEGTPTILRCMALSSPPLQSPLVTWFRNDTGSVLASGHELASYTIEDPTEEDAGEYLCRASVENLKKTAFTRIVIIQKTVSQTDIPSSTMAPTLMAGRLVEISGPSTVEEGKNLTLMCLVSPLLSFYKYLVLFNGTIMTFDETIMRHDPRLSVTFGTGGVGERLVRLTIEHVSPFDEGTYECTVNTSPIAQHSHFVSVVPEGHLSSTAVNRQTEVSSSPETFVTPELWSSLNFTYPWDTTDDSHASPGPGTEEPIHQTEASSTVSPKDFFIPASTHSYEDASDKYFKRTVLTGRSVTLPCTIPNNKESPIIWRLKENLFLISVDLLKVETDERFKIDAPDDYTRNLVIHKALPRDAGVYTCLKEVKPQVKIHYELTVLEGFYPPSEKEEEEEEDADLVLTTDSQPEEGGDKGEGAEGEGAEEGEASEEVEYKSEKDEGPGLYPVTEETEEKEEVAMGRPSEHEEESSSSEDEGDSSGEEDTEETKEIETEREEIDSPAGVGSEAGREETSREPGVIDLEGVPHEATDHPDHTDEEVIDHEDESKSGDGADKDEGLQPTKQPEDDGPAVTTLVVDEGDHKKHEPTVDDPVHISEKDKYDVVEPDTPPGAEETDGIHDHEIKGTDAAQDVEEDQDDLHGVPATDYPDGDEEPDEESDTPLEDQKERDDSHVTEEVHISSSEVSTSSPDRHEDTEDTDKEEESVEVGGQTEKPDSGDDFEKSEDVTVTPSPGGEQDTLSSTAATKIAISEEEDEDSKPREENETFVFTPDEDEEKEKEEGEKPEGGEDKKDEEKDYYEEGYDDYTYTYDDLTTTSTTTKAPVEEPPVIVAKPGEDVQAPAEAEVILPCPTKALSEDITWKDPEKLLFFGSLDLAGLEGLALSPKGELRLLASTTDIKDQKTYTCFVYDYDTHDDIPVMSYWIELSQGAPPKEPEKEDHSPKSTTRLPTSTFEFPGLEWQEVAVISNSQVSGTSLTDVLNEGGLNAVLMSDSICGSSDEISGWYEADKTLKKCEEEARQTGLIRESQSVFIIIDFTVALGHHKTYGSTLISVHNVAGNLTAHVFGPLVPLSTENGYTTVECGSPVYPSQKLLDLSSFCKSSVASSILVLQEAYLTHSKKMPMY